MSVKIDRESKVHEVVMEGENEALQFSSVSLDDICWLITNYRDETISYIIKKYARYIEPNGGKDNIVNLPPKINFPIGHLIEFFLMLKAPDKLASYIRKIRIPDAHQYVKEITEIFNARN
ncbi:hypothetical protein [Xylocopilactobacillus apicola]|uniref:hypothetical protein n=1 Tax=Xylocopilactobacillus apicola TaxID=2932184 RepID=UPI002953A6E1|nr:hypothetical protein [Xylocopilactobacillus apicola]